MNNFDRNFKRVGCMFWVVFIFNILLTVAIVSGIGWVVYMVLKHFGIVG